MNYKNIKTSINNLCLTFNQVVMGSNPIEITLNINDLRGFGFVGRFLFAYNFEGVFSLEAF